jgi:predicted PurR-regulated permease PerM
MSKPWSTTTRAIVIVLTIVLTGLLINQMRPLLSALIISGLIAYILNLFVRFIQNRTRLTRGWAVHLVYILFILLLIAAPGTLVPIAVSQSQVVTEEFQMVREQVEDILSEPVTIFGQTVPVNELLQDVTTAVTEFEVSVEGALSVIETTSVGLLQVVIIIVVSYYLMKDWRKLRKWIVDLLPESGRYDADRLMVEIDGLWRAYTQGTLALMVIVAIIFIIIGFAIGLPGAIIVGIFGGIFSMIPEIGPWLAGGLAVIVAYFGGSNHLPLSNFWFAVLVAAIFAVVAQIKSIWLRPQVMGRFMHMNTGVVFFAILAAALLQGILGALIILPILATIGVIGRYVRAKLLNIDPWQIAEIDEEITADEADQLDSEAVELGSDAPPSQPISTDVEKAESTGS